MRRETRNNNSEDGPQGGSAERYASRLMPHASPVVKRLGRVDYLATWRAMRDFTAGRDAAAPDELWVLQHSPVYTLGVAAKPEHLPRVANGIPVVRSDRGGQITYHGPGQVVVYLLLDMRRRGLGVRQLVRLMEQAVIDLLAARGITSSRRAAAPGVYVGNAKIAALGLRVRNGCCYHGLALNVDMDLAPFSVINPCGYAGLAITQTRSAGVQEPVEALSANLTAVLMGLLASA